MLDRNEAVHIPPTRILGQPMMRRDRQTHPSKKPIADRRRIIRMSGTYETRDSNYSDSQP